MKLKSPLILIIITTISFLFTTSCKKETDCKLIVKTRDSLGLPLPGVSVKLFANVKTSSGTLVEADLKAEGVSDNVGACSFTFKLPAVLDIKAQQDSSLSGIGIIKLVEGKTVEETVFLKK